ncbi:MAG: histidine kinase [Ancrocorticia sp.]
MMNETFYRDSIAARAIIVVRWVLVVWALLDVWSLWFSPHSSERPDMYGFVFPLAWTSAMIATYRPAWGALASIVPLLGSVLVDSFVFTMPLLYSVIVAVCATATWRVVIATLTGYVIFELVMSLPKAQSDMTLLLVWWALHLVLPTVIGLTIRLLLARSRRISGQIRDLEKEAESLRATERAALGQELTAVLATGLVGERERLSRARMNDDVATLRQVLAGTARGARHALSQLRGLIATLRGREEGAFRTPEAVDLLAVAEEMDEVLSGYGFWVEIDSSKMSRQSNGVTALLLGEALRGAVDSALTQAEPGALCKISLVTDEYETRVEFASSCVDSTAELRDVRQRIEAAGGSLTLEAGEGMYASVPVSPESSRPLDNPARLDRGEKRLQVVVTAIFVLGVVISAGLAVWSPDPQTRTSSTLWSIVFVGLAVSVWRPLWGSVPLAAVYIAVIWALEPAVPYGLGNVPYICLTAMVTAFAPRWSLTLLPVSVLQLEVWFGRIDEYILAGALIHWGTGVLAGSAAHYFLVVRARQRTRFEEASTDRQDARTRVRLELAGELHDIVAHQLTLISLHVDAYRDETDPVALQEAIDRVDSILASAQADLLFLFHVLRAPSGGVANEGGLGPVAAVEAAVAALRTSGRHVEVSVDPAVDDVDPTTRRTLARVVREASTNILRYAPDRVTCTLSIHRDPEWIRVTVRNPLPDRVDPSEDSTGLGLVGLAERLRLTGGSLSAGTEDGDWVVTAQLPNSGGVTPPNSLATGIEGTV